MYLAFPEANSRKRTWVVTHMGSDLTSLVRK